MKLTKVSLAGLLLEQGEEDLAVLVARSDLPEDLDTEVSAHELERIGLPPDHLQSLLPAVIARPDGRSHLSERELTLLERTISDRWAHLVAAWTASPRGAVGGG